MKQVETRVTTPRSREEVYAYLADFNNQAQWRFDVLSSELISGEPGAVGSHYRQLVKQGRKEVASDVEVTEAEPHRRVAFRGDRDARLPQAVRAVLGRAAAQDRDPLRGGARRALGGHGREVGSGAACARRAQRPMRSGWPSSRS
jgi:uncharacterized protein YndB with AHSA1/START domain